VLIRSARLKTNVVFLMSNGLIKYYFTKVAVCLLSRESVAVVKEYNLKRHNQTKRPNFGRNLSNEERKRKCQDLVYTLKKQQSVFTKQSIIHCTP